MEGRPLGVALLCRDKPCRPFYRKETIIRNDDSFGFSFAGGNYNLFPYEILY